MGRREVRLYCPPTDIFCMYRHQHQPLLTLCLWYHLPGLLLNPGALRVLVDHHLGSLAFRPLVEVKIPFQTTPPAAPSSIIDSPQSPESSPAQYETGSSDFHARTARSRKDRCEDRLVTESVIAGSASRRRGGLGIRCDNLV